MLPGPPSSHSPSRAVEQELAHQPSGGATGSGGGSAGGGAAGGSAGGCDGDGGGSGQLPLAVQAAAVWFQMQGWAPS